jgi:hypothetical protein
VCVCDLEKIFLFVKRQTKMCVSIWKKMFCVQEVDCMWVDDMFKCNGRMMMIEYFN